MINTNNAIGKMLGKGPRRDRFSRNNKSINPEYEWNNNISSHKKILKHEGLPQNFSGTKWKDLPIDIKPKISSFLNTYEYY